MEHQAPTTPLTALHELLPEHAQAARDLQLSSVGWSLRALAGDETLPSAAEMIERTESERSRLERHLQRWCGELESEAARTSASRIASGEDDPAWGDPAWGEQPPRRDRSTTGRHETLRSLALIAALSQLDIARGGAEDHDWLRLGTPEQWAELSVQESQSLAPLISALGRPLRHQGQGSLREQITRLSQGADQSSHLVHSKHGGHSPQAQQLARTAFNLRFQQTPEWRQMSPDHRAQAERSARANDLLWLSEKLLAAGLRLRWYPPSQQLWLLTGTGWQQLDDLDLNPEFCWPSEGWQYERNLGETLRGAARGLQGGTLKERQKADILLALQQTSWRVSGLGPEAPDQFAPERIAAARHLSRRWLSDAEATWLRELARRPHSQVSHEAAPEQP